MGDQPPVTSTGYTGRMIGKIFLQDIVLSSFVGVYPHEKEHRQNLIVNITLWVDFSNALQSDDIADTVDYESLVQFIVALVADKKFNLLETLVGSIADVCLSSPHVKKVTVRAAKPYILPHTLACGVEIERSQSIQD